MSPRHSLLGKRRKGMHGESSYGVRTPEQCVFSGSNPDLPLRGIDDNGSMMALQAICSSSNLLYSTINY